MNPVNHVRNLYWVNYMSRVWQVKMNIKFAKSVKILILLVVAAVVSGALIFSGTLSKSTAAVAYAEVNDISVNGEVITKDNIEKNYANLPEETRSEITKKELADNLVGNKLLVQEANKRGVTVTDEEVGNYIEQAMTLNNIDRTEIERQLSELGYTFDEYKASLKESMSISKLLDQEIDLKNIRVSDSDVDNFIQKNQAEFQDIFNEGDPELEQAFRVKVKQKLTQDKQQELVNSYVRSLRSNAEIV